MAALRGKTLLITGATRGIGKAIGVRAAKDGANVIILGKTTEPDARLPGTIHSAADEMRAAGGQALACVADVRDEKQVERAIALGVETFGGIDILVNNASAISLTGTEATLMKRFDLMHQVNVRGTFACSQLCLPFLRKGTNPHILNLSPPLNMDAKWFAPHVAYTMSKYGMSMCVLGMAEEFRPLGIAVNALWPRTAIATAAVKNLLGGDAAIQGCRTPEIVADAAHVIFSKDSHTFTGNFCIDEEVLEGAGVRDFENYAVSPGRGVPLMPDLFL